jgi:hypothetical protein
MGFALSMVAAFAVILRVRVPRKLLIGLVIAAPVVLIAEAVWRTNEARGWDYSMFWAAGRDVWEGHDPYGLKRFDSHPFFNPPSALPLFALFASLPFWLSLHVWVGLNILGTLACAWLARAALSASEGSSNWGLSLEATLALTATLAFSVASYLNLHSGQLCVLVTVALTGAIYAQARERRAAAGTLLAIATVKVGTMLPFLALFHRKGDRITWIVMIVLVGALCLAVGNPWGLPERLRTLVDLISFHGTEGRINDYSLVGPNHDTIVGLDHAIYSLGLRNRSIIRIAQVVILLVLGVGLLWDIAWTGALSKGAACSAIAFYSALFLYHRSYDMVILVLPLVYATGRAEREQGRKRWPFVAAAVLSLFVINMPLGFSRLVIDWSADRGLIGQVVQALAVPYCTWFILAGMFCIWWAARAPRGGSSISEH